MSITKSIYLLVLFLSTGFACNIWKASDCPTPPTADDEEIVRELIQLFERLIYDESFQFKYDLYTREQLFQFCDQGKKYAECVNKRLQCCDLKSEHTGALAAYDVGLQQNVSIQFIFWI